MLLAAGREAKERIVTREFERITATVARDLGRYPETQRTLTETIQRIDEDHPLSKSRDTPKRQSFEMKRSQSVGVLPVPGGPLLRVRFAQTANTNEGEQVQTARRSSTRLSSSSARLSRNLSDGDADAEAGREPESSELEVETVTTRKALKKLVEVLEAAELIAFDTEPTSLEPLDADLVGFAFSVEPGKAFYVPVGHADQDNEFGRDEAVAALAGVLADPDRSKLAQHTKYDLNVLRRAGLELAGIRHDTMLESYCYNATATRHDLDSLAARYLGRQTTTYEQVAGKGKQQLSFDQVPVAQAANYAGEDAEVCLALHRKLWPEVSKYPGVKKVYEELEIPLIDVLARMEARGVLVDRDHLTCFHGQCNH